MNFIEYIKAVLLGIVEGITEWLPISSTGHMILLDEFIKLNLTENFKQMLLVVIQLGAILAVPVLFWNKLNPFSRKKNREEREKIYGLWLKVIVGVLPCAIVGILLDSLLEAYLYNYVVVSIALIVYGVLFILVERRRKNKEYRIESVYDITYKDALIIGSYQMLSLIPGTSRSGSTILGGMLSGVSRTASAEFSFFMAIPVMLGASLLKILKFTLGYLKSDTPAEYIPDGLFFEYFMILLVALAVSFVVSFFAIKFLMDFVKRHSFAPFGIYRIGLGIVVVVYFIIKTAIM